MNRITGHLDSSFRKKIWGDILSLAWPCMTELFLMSFIGMANLMMVGHLGTYAISAVGITNQPVLIGLGIFQAFNVGSTALVARFVGAKEYKDGIIVARQTLILSLVVGIVICIPQFIYARFIVEIMGAQEDIIVHAELYMKYVAVGMFFQIIGTGISSLLRGAGDTKSPMRYNIIANIINVVLGYLLIFGFWFIPAMGIAGAGIASLVAKIAACVLALYAIFDRRSTIPIILNIKDKFQLDFSMIKRIMNIGYAAAGEQMVLRIGVLVFTRLVIGLGVAQFAAHQITINLLSLSFSSGQAFGIAATSLMGRSLGAKEPDLAECYGQELRRLGMYMSLILGVAFFTLGPYMARLYSSDENVIAIVGTLLKIVGFIMPFQNSQLIIAGGLRGAGDTRWPLIAIIAGVLGVRVVLGVLFIEVLYFGIIGAWVAIAIDQITRSTVIYMRFKTGRWKYIKV